MEFIKQLERLQLLNKLVRQERTGSPEKLAKRLGVSRSKLYLMLEELRDEGVEIRFSKKADSFIYKNCKGIDVNFSVRVLTERESIDLMAGGINFSSKSIFLDGRKINLRYGLSYKGQLF
jgi:biotin operon repressor